MSGITTIQEMVFIETTGAFPEIPQRQLPALPQLRFSYEYPSGVGIFKTTVQPVESDPQALAKAHEVHERLCAAERAVYEAVRRQSPQSIRRTCTQFVQMIQCIAQVCTPLTRYEGMGQQFPMHTTSGPSTLAIVYGVIGRGSEIVRMLDTIKRTTCSAKEGLPLLSQDVSAYMIHAIPLIAMILTKDTTIQLSLPDLDDTPSLGIEQDFARMGKELRDAQTQAEADLHAEGDRLIAVGGALPPTLPPVAPTNQAEEQRRDGAVSTWESVRNFCYVCNDGDHGLLIAFKVIMWVFSFATLGLLPFAIWTVSGLYDCCLRGRDIRQL